MTKVWVSLKEKREGARMNVGGGGVRGEVLGSLEGEEKFAMYPESEFSFLCSASKDPEAQKVSLFFSLFLSSVSLSLSLSLSLCEVFALEFA